MNAPIIGFRGLSHFVTEVVRAEVAPQARHPGLRWASPTGANEITPSEGGFVVPADIAADLFEPVYDTGILLSSAASQPMTGSTIKVPAIHETSRATGSRFGGVRGYWANEADTVTESMPKFRSINLDLNKWFGIAYGTGEWLEDASAAAAILKRAFTLEATFAIEEAMIAGPGAGQMLGVLNSLALITITPESGQAAGTIRAENVVKMYARCWAPSMRRAIWLHNQEAAQQLFHLSISSGDVQVPLVTFAEGGPLLCGRPLIAHESCRAIGSVGDLILIDPTQYLVGQKAPEFAESLMLRFLQHEGVFRFSWLIAGSPAWVSAITPMFGSSTVSPFVALGARQ